jgi:hypothetical protein
VTDRPTKAHEYLFLLAKSERYFWDAEAVREPMAEASAARYAYAFGGQKNETLTAEEQHGAGTRTHPIGRRKPTVGRNRRTVWTIATEPCRAAHFAVMPTKLVEPCILAGSSERGQCPACGAPWRRVVEVHGETPREKQRAFGAAAYASSQPRNPQGLDYAGSHGSNTRPRTTLGWQPSCYCPPADPIPQLLLDPFAGAGTVGLVATRLQRRFIGCELNPAYAQIARDRITGDAPLLNGGAL